MTEWVFAVDLGTSGLKVGAIGVDGQVLATHEVPLTTTFIGEVGVEQDTDQWWSGIVAGAHALVDQGLDGDAVLAVAITGQYGSTVPVAASLQAVGPCLVWADRRGGARAKAQYGGLAAGYKSTVVASWLRYTGGLPTPTGSDPGGHALWLRYDDSDIYASARWLLEPVDFLGMRFTGDVAATPASMVASWLTDNRPERAVRYVPKLVERAGREREKLPPLRPSGGLLGELTGAVAAELGLRPGTPVASGISDLHAAHVGSGALGQNQGHVAVSTTSWISCAVPFKKTDIIHQMASIPGLRAGEYLVINNQETAGASLQWVRDQLFAGTVTLDDLTSFAATTSPGAGGVMFTPWLKGERSPVDDLRLRGGFLNLGLSNNRADIVRAVMEGVAYESRWLAEHVDSFVDQRLDPLRMLGGGARSSLWCQIYADVLDRRIEQVADPAVAQLRGAACASLIASRHMTWDEIAVRVPVANVYDPNPDVRTRYDDSYAAFRDAHKRLRGWYHRLEH